MKGFKTIEQLSLKDSYAILQNGEGKVNLDAKTLLMSKA